ncbi:MAG: helix-turn-helix transcriptional regulator [Streptococcaceae bacterium]|jgi:DNA-binding Xre family transcriptional regulator|nr:helix-turn-helix transcriptional regulator [Streptococcaceae bacterium]
MWEKIEKMMIERKISIYQLAKMAKIPRESLYSMKRQRAKSASFNTVVKIADALGVSLDEFRKEVENEFK